MPIWAALPHSRDVSLNQRVLKLMERLALDQREAVLVHNPSNMFYLSGYTGEGLVLIGREMQTIITDFRYTEQAEKQAPGFSVEMTEKGVSHEAIVGRLCAEHEIGALYYEDDYLTVRSFESCRKAVPGVEWKSLHEEVQHIRQIKDEDGIEGGTMPATYPARAFSAGRGSRPDASGGVIRTVGL